MVSVRQLRLNKKPIRQHLLQSRRIAIARYTLSNHPKTWHTSSDSQRNGIINNLQNQMMHLAGLKGEDVQMKLAKKLFAMHFEGDTDVTCQDHLLKASIAAGLAENEAMDWLYSDNGGAEVDEEAQRARDSGVSSVPTFEINGRRLEGAEDASAFYQAFADIKASS